MAFRRSWGLQRGLHIGIETPVQGSVLLADQVADPRHGGVESPGSLTSAIRASATAMIALAAATETISTTEALPRFLMLNNLAGEYSPTAPQVGRSVISRRTRALYGRVVSECWDSCCESIELKAGMLKLSGRLQASRTIRSEIFLRTVRPSDEFSIDVAGLSGPSP